MKIERNHLLVALGLLLLFLLIRWGMSGGDVAAVETREPVNRRVTRAIGGAGRPENSEQAPVTEVASLDLDALNGERQEREPGRNLWQYGRVQAPPVQPPAPIEPPPVPRNVQPAPPVETVPFEPPKPQPPPVDVDFLGTFGPPSRRIAVFTDADDVLYNAFEGDTVKDKFIVQAIGFESVDLGFVGFADASAQRLEIKK